VDGSGDGHTSPDWVVARPTARRTIRQRDRRTYTIVFVCADETGQTAKATVLVTVPHDGSP
jgi:hypothetical protein